MLRTSQIILTVFFFPFLLESCGRLLPGDKIREGIVEYEIAYLENMTDNILTDHMPSKMTMKFRKHVSRNEIQGFFGFFELINISDLQKASNTTMLKVLDKKYYYMGTPHEQPCCFDTMEGMVVEFTEETKDICGLTCKKANIRFPEKNAPPFVVYYTDEIQVHQPNITNPFHEIDGVLMEFEIWLHNLRMRMSAYNVVEKKISEKEFSIPAEYQRISKNDMEQIVQNLLN
ncbi:MAG TPA: hypothetical protein ENN63_08045 [Bacteroidetes bacterium]|nr:hypothetical protein [Bacteroidota bacterium]